MTAITIGSRTRPNISSIDMRIIQLQLGDSRGVTLMPGQSIWKWELSLCLPILPVCWPVLVVNDDGRMRKYVMGFSGH